jgi:phosphohistidine phosphatase
MLSSIMRLIIIRHGRAGDRESFAKTGKDDALRPLTAEGKRRMKQGAKGLRRVIAKIDLLATSPLKRAAQTAAIVYGAYGDKPQFVELDLLSGHGQDPAKFVSWLKEQDLDAATVAIIGHEPDLSHWAGWMLTSQKKGLVMLKKGAVCVIDFPTRVAGGKGVLYGLYQPGDLRKL